MINREAVSPLPEWNEIARTSLTGLVMILGATDVGKSTFARWLAQRLAARASARSAFLDGDPGQSRLGPPTTVTLAMTGVEEDGTLSFGRRWRRFVGSTTPARHMLQLLVGVARLVGKARAEGAGTIIHDTTGLVAPELGGAALKAALVDLLRPSLVVAIRRSQELEPILRPLRASRRARLVELLPSPEVAPRSAEARRRHRAARFARYFRGADSLRLDPWRSFFLQDEGHRRHRLVAFEDAAGFVLALGIILDEKTPPRILTPLRNPAPVDAVRTADLLVDPSDFSDELLTGR